MSGWYSEDPTVRAITRGRAITSHLARLVADSDRGAFWVDMRSVLSGGTPVYAEGQPNAGEPVRANGLLHNGQPGELLRHVWATHMPSFGEDRPHGRR